MSKPRRSFTPEFKQEAVDLYRRSGKSGCQVARELGIGQTTLNRWTRQAATAPLGAKSFLATEELKVLRREVDQLRMERDIVKNHHARAARSVAPETPALVPSSSREERPSAFWSS